MNYAHSVTDRFVGLVTIVSEHRQALETQFARILSEYGAAISRLAFSYEAVASVREELVQEIALAIWQHWLIFEATARRTFVYRIAHNRGLTHVGRRRPPHQPLEELEDSDQPVDPGPHPEEQAARTDQRVRLMSAIQSLPVTHRKMVVLALEGLLHTEIAEVMGITENNVEVRLTRIRKALKDALGERP
jgi:RNA polymerase sigma factor (sigma-70 family)